ncbi:MAG: TolC family outer membrane protein [Hahellaceae bacterium]|jgi:outer membrane protein|nr:TolC family outer membrane protein [Hahellaceae bacterium]
MKTFARFSPRPLLLTAAIALAGASTPGWAIDLSTAYQKALNYDSELAAAAAGRNAQAENTNLSRSALMPIVAAGASTEHTDMNPDRFPEDSYLTSGVQLSVTQPLLAMDSLYTYQASKDSEQKANEDYRSAQLDLLYRTANAYFTVLRGMDDLETAKKAEAAFRRQWEQAKERFEVGLIAITEVHETKAIYDSGKVTRINTQGQLDIALEALQRITGEFVDQIHPLNETLSVEETEIDQLTNLEQIALENSPLIKGAVWQLESARKNFKAKQAGYYPTLDLGASAGYSDYTGPYTQDDKQTDTKIGLTLNVPIYLGGSTQASTRQARYQVDQAEQGLLTAQRNVRLQLRSLYRSLQTNAEAIQARKQETISNESALQATRAGYDVGTRNIVEVLDAERKYYVSLSAYANARYDYILNRLTLRQTTGALQQGDLDRLNQMLTAPVRISGG